MQKISCLKEMGCAIFDLDGTLADSATIWEDFVSETLRRYNVPLPEGLHDGMKTQMAPQVPRYLIDTVGLPVCEAELLDAMGEYLREGYRNVAQLKPGAQAYLRQLKRQGVPMCIATASGLEYFAPVLEKNNILELFDFVACCSDIGRNKNTPDVYLYCAQRYGLTPGQCAVFEDSRNAVRTASRAGFYTVCVADPCSLHLREEILGMCDLYIQSFEELLEG